MRLTFIILSIILWLTSYFICQFYYPGETEVDKFNWWVYKTAFYSINIGMVGGAFLFFKENKFHTNWINFLLWVFILGMLLPTSFDKIVFLDNERHLTDILFIFFSIYRGMKKSFPETLSLIITLVKKCLCLKEK